MASSAAEVADPTLVDVGIPTYGEPRFLAQAVESVIAQTFMSWRLTISENGPGSDQVAAAIQPYLSDPRIRYVVTGRNLGGPANSTRLIQTGQAPFVALLHDDDLWDGEFLERRVTFLQANPACGFVFSPSTCINENGEVLYEFVPDLVEGVQDRKSFLRLLYHTNVIWMPTILVRRSSYEEVGPFFKDGLPLDDYEMWLRLAAKFEAGFLVGSDAHYRVHSSQITRRLRREISDHRLRVLDEVESFLPRDISRLMRRRVRFICFVRSFIDALACRQPREALRYLGRALRVYPLGFVDPKVALQVLQRLQRRNEDRAFWRADAAE